jgi:hypothetical protein
VLPKFRFRRRRLQTFLRTPRASLGTLLKSEIWDTHFCDADSGWATLRRAWRRDIMAEEPIKLFATRRERYPQRSEGDIAYGAASKLIEQIPVVGAIIAYVASTFLGPSLRATQRRVVETVS